MRFTRNFNLSAYVTQYIAPDAIESSYWKYLMIQRGFEYSSNFRQSRMFMET